MAVTLNLPSTTGTASTKRRRFSAWRQLSPKAKVGAYLCGFFALVAIVGPYFAPYDPSAQHAVVGVSLHPTGAHPLGLTTFGQDVLSQLLVGTRQTVVIGILAAMIATVLAVIIGISAGYLSGWWDEGLSLFSNVVLVLPALPLLIVLLGYFKNSGSVPVILVLGLLGWPWGARVIRAQTLSLRNRDFVAAARETGDSTARLIFFEIMPNQVSLIAASFVSTVLYAIGTSVALAFIGVIGVNTWSLGTMLYWADSQSAVFGNYWWWFVPPGVVTALIGTGLVLLNFGIDELGNPRLREAAGGSRIGGRRWRPADPTPVALVRTVPPAAERLAATGALARFVRSFSRRSLLESRQSETTPRTPVPEASR
jgi:peptide/nickel transport system permease protein